MRRGPVILLAGVAIAALAALAVWWRAPGHPPVGPRAEEAGPAAPAGAAPADGTPAGAGTLEVAVLLGGRPARAALEIRPAERGGRTPDHLAVGPEGRAGPVALPVGDYGVRARGESGAAVTARVRVSPAGARVLVRLDLPDGEHTLRGRALRVDGSPSCGTVAAADHGWIDERAVNGATAPEATDAEGRFTIAGLRAGLVMLRAVAPDGAEWTTGPFRVPGSGEVTFVVDAGATPLAGRVLDVEDDRPVAGAEVEYQRPSTPHGEQATARTDAGGCFRIRRKDGCGKLLVRADGYAPADLDVEPGVSEIDLRIGRASFVSGTVVAAEDGRALPGLVVQGAVRAGGSSARAITGSEGEFRLPALPPGRLDLVAFGPGRASPVVTVDTARGESRAVRLVAGPAARLEGAVLDEGGVGLAGAPVRIDELGLETLSEGDGAFGFAALPPAAPLRVSAFPAGRAEATALLRTAGPGGTTRVALRTVASRSVEILAVEEGTGAPVAGALVAVNLLRPPGSWHHAFTGPDGIARFTGLPTARTTVRIDAPGHVCADAVPDIPDSPGDVVVRVVLCARIDLRGRVLQADGTPAAWAHVTADRDDGPRVSALSDESGAFRLLGLVPGLFIVDAVTVREGERGRIEAEAGAADAVIRLCAPDPDTGPPALTFLVLDTGGRRVPSCEVRVETIDRGGRDFEASRLLRVTDGRAESRWTARADLEVTGFRVTDARDASGLPLPLGDVIGGPVSSGAPATIEVRLPPELVIDGEVLAPDGTPVRGVRVRATGPAGEAYWSHAVWTDSGGRFRFDRLVAGSYRVRPGDHVGWDVRVAAGTRDLVLRLAAEDFMTVRVVDPEGRPVPGARGPGGDAPATGPEDGAVLLVMREPVPIDVRPPPDRPDLAPARIPFAGGTEVTLVLPRALFVRGFVREAGGAGVPGISLEGVALDSWSPGSGRTASDGSFELGPFTEGPVALRVPRAHRDLRPGLERVVAAGAEGVVLPWERGGNLVVRVRGGSGEGEFVLTDEESGGTSRGCSRDGPGVYRFDDLPPGRTFSFLWRNPEGVAFLRGLRADEEHSVDAGPGVSLRVRLAGPEGLAVTYDLDLDLAGLCLSLTGSGTLPAEAIFTVLPAAAGELRFRGTVDGRQVSLRKPVLPGTREVSIDVTPR